MKDDVIIIIPTYNPDEEFENLVNNLEKNKYKNIIVVDDGSQNKDKLKNIKGKVFLLENKQNEGKGNALKKAIKYSILHLKEINGVITVDADGQHRIEDINKIYTTFQRNKNSVILGSRDFNQKNVPFRSKIGNKIVCYILNKKYHKELQDTQTGLRAIPKEYLKHILLIEGERYEYETNMMLYFINNGISIIEIPIETIYFNKNKSSHYNIIQDSWKIYKTINNLIKNVLL